MPENKSQKADDFTDDLDMDLDDIEAEADIVDDADDSWDEFDEDAATADGDAPAAKVRPAKAKKSSGGKFLGLLIIVAAAAGGGWYVMNGTGAGNLMPADTASTETDSQNNGIVELSGDMSPPMPAPIDSASEPADISEGTPVAEAPASDASLTPLPGEAPDASAGTLEAQPSPIPMKADETAGEVTPVDIAQDTAGETVPAESESALTPSDALAVPVVAEETPAAPPVVEETAVAPIAEEPAPSININKMQSDFAAERTQMQSKLDDANAEIASLKEQISAIEAKAEEAAKEPPAPVAAEAPQEESRQETPVPILRNEPKSASIAAPVETPQEMPATRIVRSDKWQLRSAQPGRAMLSPIGSNETKNVAIGDTVDSLGKITSINIEGGTWIVRGTKGFVSR